tara:strand:- start:872 stop:1267 length:396 start_codon:yes stop_codon:yes gene_type:complete
MYLILKTPSKEYASAISHELWMLARPRGISDNETSQFFCGTLAHPDGAQLCIGPLDGSQPVHADADEVAFGQLIGPAITEEGGAAIVAAITEAKGGSIRILDLIEASPSLLPNLRTREQLDAEGWFVSEEI